LPVIKNYSTTPGIETSISPELLASNTSNVSKYFKLR
jgi:hypothetical protein